MKYLLLLLLVSGCSSVPDSAYLKVGAGYKFEETEMTWTNYNTGKTNRADNPISARIEVGMECVWENVTCGVSHHSQWFSGFPIDSDGEYSKTEVFVDYKFNLSELFK